MSKAVEPQVRLKGNMYARPDYFTTDVSKGATRTPSGTRICTLTSDFLLGFRDALVYECGQSFKQVMKMCGKRWGKTFVSRFEKELTSFYQTPVKELPAGVVHACLADAFAFHGWGRLTIDLSASDHGIVMAKLSDSVMPALIKESDRPVDHLATGLLAAILSHFANAELDAVQTECPTRGATAAQFIIAAPARVAEIESWLDNASTDEPLTHKTIVQRLTGTGMSPEPEINGVHEPVSAP